MSSNAKRKVLTSTEYSPGVPPLSSGPSPASGSSTRNSGGQPTAYFNPVLYPSDMGPLRPTGKRQGQGLPSGTHIKRRPPSMPRKNNYASPVSKQPGNTPDGANGVDTKGGVNPQRDNTLLKYERRADPSPGPSRQPRRHKSRTLAVGGAGRQGTPVEPDTTPAPGSPGPRDGTLSSTQRLSSQLDALTVSGTASASALGAGRRVVLEAGRSSSAAARPPSGRRLGSLLSMPQGASTRTKESTLRCYLDLCEQLQEVPNEEWVTKLSESTGHGSGRECDSPNAAQTTMKRGKSPGTGRASKSSTAAVSGSSGGLTRSNMSRMSHLSSTKSTQRSATDLCVEQVVAYCDQHLHPLRSRMEQLRQRRDDVQQSVDHFVRTCAVQSVQEDATGGNHSTQSLQQKADTLSDSLKGVQHAVVQLLLRLADCAREAKKPLGVTLPSTHQGGSSSPRPQLYHEQKSGDTFSSAQASSPSPRESTEAPNAGFQLGPVPLLTPSCCATNISYSSPTTPASTPKGFVNFVTMQEREVAQQLQASLTTIRQTLQTNRSLVRVENMELLSTPLFLLNTTAKGGLPIVTGSQRSRVEGSSKLNTPRNNVGGTATKIPGSGSARVLPESVTAPVFSVAYEEEEEDNSRSGTHRGEEESVTTPKAVLVLRTAPVATSSGTGRARPLLSGASNARSRSSSVGGTRKHQKRSNSASIRLGSNNSSPKANAKPSSIGAATLISQLQLEDARAVWEAVSSCMPTTVTPDANAAPAGGIHCSPRPSSAGAEAGRAASSHHHESSSAPRRAESSPTTTTTATFAASSPLRCATQSPSKALFTDEADHMEADKKTPLAQPKDHPPQHSSNESSQSLNETVRTTSKDSPLVLQGQGVDPLAVDRQVEVIQKEMAEATNGPVTETKTPAITTNTTAPVRIMKRRPVKTEDDLTPTPSSSIELLSTVRSQLSAKTKVEMPKGTVAEHAAATKISAAWRVHRARRDAAAQSKLQGSLREKRQAQQERRVKERCVQQFLLQLICRRRLRKAMLTRQRDSPPISSAFVDGCPEMSSSKASSSRERFQRARDQRRALNGSTTASPLQSSPTRTVTEVTVPKSVTPLPLIEKGISTKDISRYNHDSDGFEVAALHRLIRAPLPLIYCLSAISSRHPTQPPMGYAKPKRSSSQPGGGDAKEKDGSVKRTSPRVIVSTGDVLIVPYNALRPYEDYGRAVGPAPQPSKQSATPLAPGSSSSVAPSTIPRGLVCNSIRYHSYVDVHELKYDVPVVKPFARPFERWGLAQGVCRRIFCAAAMYAWKLIFSHTPHDDYKQRQLTSSEERAARFDRVDQRNRMILACYCVHTEREWLREASKDLSFVGQIWNPKKSLDPNDPDFERHCAETYEFVEDFLYQCFPTVNALEDIPSFLVGAGIYSMLKEALQGPPTELVDYSGFLRHCANNVADDVASSPTALCHGASASTRQPGGEPTSTTYDNHQQQAFSRYQQLVIQRYEMAFSLEFVTRLCAKSSRRGNAADYFKYCPRSAVALSPGILPLAASTPNLDVFQGFVPLMGRRVAKSAALASANAHVKDKKDEKEKDKKDEFVSPQRKSGLRLVRVPRSALGAHSTYANAKTLKEREREVMIALAAWYKDEHKQEDGADGERCSRTRRSGNLLGTQTTDELSILFPPEYFVSLSEKLAYELLGLRLNLEVCEDMDCTS